MLIYTDLINKITKVTDKVAPFKKVCVKDGTSEWIDDKIFDGIQAWEKKSEFKSQLHADHIKNRRAQNQVQTQIKE